MFSLKEQFIKDFPHLTERYSINHHFSDFCEWIDEIQSRFPSNKRTVFLELAANEDWYDFKMTIVTNNKDPFDYYELLVSEIQFDNFTVVMNDQTYEISRVNNLTREELKKRLYNIVFNHLVESAQ